MITDLPTKRFHALSQWQAFLTVLPTRWRLKLTGIDIEHNYVTVTLYIASIAILVDLLPGQVLTQNPISHMI